METRRAVIDYLQRPPGDGGHAVLIDFTHGEGMNTRIMDDFALTGVYIADPDQGDICRVDLGAEAHDVFQVVIAFAQQVRKRHAMDISRGRNAGHVHVAMGIEPDQANGFVLPAIVAGCSGKSPHGDGVITPQDEGKISIFQDARYPLRQLRAYLEYLRFEPGLDIFRRSCFHGRGRDVFFARDGVAHPAQCISQPGNSQGGRSDVRSSPAGSEVEGHADNPHRLFHLCRHVQGMLVV